MKREDKFKYLGAMIDKEGNMNKEINHRIQAGWNSWRMASGVLCDRRVPIKLKGKFHRTVVRPAMTYGMEAAPLKKTEEKKMDVTENKMLRWMSGLTKLDRIRNEKLRGTVKVTEVSKKAQEARLRWFGHLMRREEWENHVGREVMELEVRGRRKRGRPKRRWKDCIEEDMRSKGVDVRMTHNRGKWRRLTKNSDPA